VGKEIFNGSEKAVLDFLGKVQNYLGQAGKDDYIINYRLN